MSIWTGEVPTAAKRSSPHSGIMGSRREPESDIDNAQLNLSVALGKIDWTKYRALPSWELTNPLEITIHRIPFDENRMLIRRERIVMYATKSEGDQYFIAEFEDLEMLLWGESVKELKEAFEAMLRMMWKRYVMGDPQKMTKGALEFRNRLDAAYRLA